jgi:DNA-directed RNA polymerase specialized sigma24 family protein
VPAASPDRALLERIAAGHRPSLQRLRARYETTTYALAYGILLDRVDADTIVRDTFDEVWWLAPWLLEHGVAVRRWLVEHVRDAARAAFGTTPPLR